MIHETISIFTNESEVKLHTYILDNSPEIDSERTRPMVIICPGGGYEFTSDREAEPVAIKLNALGFHASILRYSVKPATYPTALIELAATVSLMRKNAEKWHIDSNRIIVAGFSAGGHLAASLGVFWKKQLLSEVLNVKNAELKPNGLLLSYPVITSGPSAHKGSFKALLGDKHNELLHEVSLEKQVTADTPPTFLWHTYTDNAVPVENSLLFAQSLLENKVSLELHIYPKGNHGLSLGTEETSSKHKPGMVQNDVSNWIEMAARWINSL